MHLEFKVNCNWLQTDLANMNSQETIKLAVANCVLQGLAAFTHSCFISSFKRRSTYDSEDAILQLI